MMFNTNLLFFCCFTFPTAGVKLYKKCWERICVRMFFLSFSQVPKSGMFFDKTFWSYDVFYLVLGMVASAVFLNLMTDFYCNCCILFLSFSHFLYCFWSFRWHVSSGDLFTVHPLIPKLCQYFSLVKWQQTSTSRWRRRKKQFLL